jgi:uncharacterized membrane protein YeaQ/YmgE (transglycosylase-associated protein family)
MIGMDFIGFLILLVIAVAVAAIVHFGFKFYIVPDWWSFLGKTVLAWIGAWLGSPVLGHWWPGLNYGEIYFIPAIIGSAGAIILSVDLFKTLASCVGGKQGTTGE